MPAVFVSMLELQENIAKVQSATTSLRRNLVDNAVREYFATLDLIGSPTAGDFTAAEGRANVVLKQELLSANAIALVNGDAPIDDDGVAFIALSFDSIAKPLRTPGPAAGAETRPTTLALAAAGGTIGGMMLGGALMRLAYDMRDVGLALGGPIGAFLAVLLMNGVARVRLLTRILPWLFVRPKALRGAFRSEHEKAVRAAVEQWVDWAIPMLAVLCMHRAGTPQSKTDKDKALKRLGKLIYSLHQSTVASLPVVAHELIQEAKNSGFEGIEGQPAFAQAGPQEKETMTWSTDLQSKYETFGHITDGDPVTVERPAVVFGGQIVQRGLVRKVRDR
ncbi:MAG: hypothetical protein ABFE01_28310 [Phycisphaerales bacterium]